MRYLIDTGVSRFTIRAFSRGWLSALAHNPSFVVRQYEGVVQFDPVEPTSAALTLRIAASSLDLVDDVSANDRREILRIMHQEVLEDQKYPTIKYDAPPAAAAVNPTSSGEYDVRLNGTLTLHNTSRPQAVLAHVTASPGLLRANGDFSVKQTDFGIHLVSAAGGSIKVKDELKCTFDVVARP